MDWSALGFYINQLSKDQKRKPVTFFDPYYKRLIEVKGMDAIKAVVEGSADSSPTLIGSEDRT